MAKKHFMIYYHNGTGTFVVTEPKPWARENQQFFNDYDFINKKPTTNVIEKKLIKQFKFKIKVDNEKIKLIQNLDTNLSFDN